MLLHTGTITRLKVDETAATDHDLVTTPGANKAILVLNYEITATDGSNVNWEWHDEDGLNITGMFDRNSDTVDASYSPVGHFLCTENKGLRLNVSQSEAIGGFLVYQVIDV